MLIHGGFWRFRPEYMDGPVPLGAAFAERGWDVWEPEYRALGAGGGWPATLDDVAAAIDHLAELHASHGIAADAPVTVGHSAGAISPSGRPPATSRAYRCAPRSVSRGCSTWRSASARASAPGRSWGSSAAHRPSIRSATPRRTRPRASCRTPGCGSCTATPTTWCRFRRRTRTSPRRPRPVRTRGSTPSRATTTSSSTPPIRASR
ncbi:alpha/beta hydrolase [Pseudolysinimonas kribbensis]|uniref:alpha/beta hydrolase n=1 Tax=Pseudolysinimonas kribbensis TaxID=433641 RepID=UPI003D66D210